MQEVKRYALVRAGTVVDAILWDGVAGETWQATDDALEPPEGWVPFSQAFGADAQLIDTGDTGASPGWLYADGVFTPPAPPEMPDPPAPRVVTRRQGRRALLAAGLLDLVPQVIAALPDKERREAEIDWEDATEFDRDSELLQRLAPALGLDDAALDDLFRAAAEY